MKSRRFLKKGSISFSGKKTEMGPDNCIRDVQLKTQKWNEHAGAYFLDYAWEDETHGECMKCYCKVERIYDKDGNDDVVIEGTQKKHRRFMPYRYAKAGYKLCCRISPD